MTFLTANTGIHPRQGFVSNCHTFASCAKNGWSSVASNTPVNVSFGESKLDGAKKDVSGTHWERGRQATFRHFPDRPSNGVESITKCRCAEQDRATKSRY
jgi:hypothetical protein